MSFESSQASATAAIDPDSIALAWSVTAGLMADTLYFFEVNHNACSRRLAAVVVPGLPLELVLVEVRSAHAVHTAQPAHTG